MNPLEYSCLLECEAGTVCKEEFSFRTGMYWRLGKEDMSRWLFGNSRDGKHFGAPLHHFQG